MLVRCGRSVGKCRENLLRGRELKLKIEWADTGGDSMELAVDWLRNHMVGRGVRLWVVSGVGSPSCGTGDFWCHDQLWNCNA